MFRNHYLLYLLITLTIVFTGCSKKTDQELWTNAQKDQKEALEDTTRNPEKIEAKLKDAIMNYDLLVKDYPQSPNAPKSLFEIAKLYHGKAIKSIPETESLKKGVLYYERIFKEYPKSSEAPKALFMTGFIHSNDLHNFDSATIAYKQFLEKYPDNEMASSAKAELDNMGLTPQEVIRKNLDSKNKLEAKK